MNATSVGLGTPGADEPEEVIAGLGLARLDPPDVVVDLVYGSVPTPVLAWAERGGARTVDGLEILVRQGARSFERWTGVPPPLEVMRVAARGG